MARGAPPMPRIFPCHHVALFVRDIEKTTRFYTRMLGFRPAKESVVDAGIMYAIFKIRSAARLLFLARDGFGVELIYFLNATVRKRHNLTIGTNHWALIVDDKGRFCRNLARKKVAVLSAPKPPGIVYFIQDPEGNLIEVKDTK